VPPRVSFRNTSSTARLNPNLYTNGHVCLSLLNTWNGDRLRRERWSRQSSLLQLLLSFQSLVLNAEPYFNENDLDLIQTGLLWVWTCVVL
jgi:ubiquitin-conjugating enzyme E2 O